MKVYYKFYDLHPQRSFNRLSSAQSRRRGVHLKIDVRRDKSFADFFSHPQLGDINEEEFLDRFKFQEDEMSQKTFHFLLNDAKSRLRFLENPKSFKNHTLWAKESNIFESEVFKFKLSAEDDFTFLHLLEKNKSVRLDANGVFTKESLASFVKKIDPGLLSLIEYLEDPTHEEWPSDSPIKFARDFIDQQNHQVRIFKPNREFMPKTMKPMIFSSYMGGQLGQWQAYCELMATGDLNLYHGIQIDHFYETDIFKKMAPNTFTADKARVKYLYDELMSAEWKVLCSI